MSTWSKVVYGLGSVFILVILSVFLCYVWYTGGFDLFGSSEHRRKRTDSLLKQWHDKRMPAGRFINNVVFGNADKYVWRPPRVMPVYDQNRAISGYDIFGLVTAWEPEARLLHMRSYTRQNLVIRLDPELDNSIAVIAPMDRQGAIPTIDAIQIVGSTDFSNWDQLFCVGDTVAVQVHALRELEKGSMSNPIVPIHVRLEHRLCGT